METPVLEFDSRQSRILSFLKAVGLGSHLPQEKQINLEDYSHKLSNRATNIFMVYDERDIAHLAFYLTRTSLFVSSLSVLTEWRNSGLGAKLIRTGSQIGAIMGRERIELETSTTNTYAKAFYIRLGFEPTASNSPNKVYFSKRIPSIFFTEE